MARDKCKIHPCVSYGYEKVGYFNAQQLENLSNSQGKGCPTTHHTYISTLQLHCRKKTNFQLCPTLSHSLPHLLAHSWSFFCRLLKVNFDDMKSLSHMLTGNAPQF